MGIQNIYFQSNYPQQPLPEPLDFSIPYGLKTLVMGRPQAYILHRKGSSTTCTMRSYRLQGVLWVPKLPINYKLS